MYQCRKFNIFIQCLVRHVKVSLYESIQLRNYPNSHKFNADFKGL